MAYAQGTIYTLYKKLLRFYPREFRERLSESMEQTFHDLWNEKRQTKQEVFGFVVWTLVETAIGIVREYILLIKEMDPIKNSMANLGSAAGISFLMLLPFLLMELVNRQNFRASGEEFPIPLFIFLFIWGMVFIFILTPFVQSLRAWRDDRASPEPEVGSILTKILANPRSAEIIVFVLALPFLAISTLRIFNIEPPFAQALNQPDPDKPNFYNTIIPLGAFLLAIAASLIARASIVRTLQGRGRLLAHPISLILVLVMLFILAWSWGSFVIDQWPCFVGVPGCD